jgi:hypothetical protein
LIACSTWAIACCSCAATPTVNWSRLPKARSQPSASPYEIDLWAAQQLSAEHVALLADLPHPVTLDVEGFGPVVFCHGTPRDDDESSSLTLGSTRRQDLRSRNDGLGANLSGGDSAALSGGLRRAVDLAPQPMDCRRRNETFRSDAGHCHHL